MLGSYTIYDPGRGEDYRVEIDGVDFSSLAANVYVIHGSGIDWTDVAFELDALFHSAGSVSYLVYRPWWPGIGNNVAALRAAFPDASGTLQQFAVQRLTPRFVQTVLEFARDARELSISLDTF